MALPNCILHTLDITLLPSVQGSGFVFSDSGEEIYYRPVLVYSSCPRVLTHTSIEYQADDESPDDPVSQVAPLLRSTANELCRLDGANVSKSIICSLLPTLSRLLADEMNPVQVLLSFCT